MTDRSTVDAPVARPAPPDRRTVRRKGSVGALWSTLRRSPSLVVGMVIFGLLVVLAVLAPVISPYDAFAVDTANTFAAPAGAHWFGTDELGRDLFSRTLFGARASLMTGAFAALGAAAVGVPLGLLAGYFGKVVDAIIMRIVDVQIAIPNIVLALIIIVLAGRGFVSSIVAVGVASIPAFARIVRASTIAIKEEEYVTAVKALGAGHGHTMLRTILPNAWGPIIVQLVITAAVAILLEAALSFLGLGTQPPDPTWGDMLRTGKNFLNNAPHYAILPGVMLTLTVLSLDLMGRGLERLRGGSSTSTEPEARA